MKEACERVVRVGLQRNPKKIFDEIDQVTAGMAREGWSLHTTCLEESMGNIHLLFERAVATTAPSTIRQPQRETSP